MSEKDRKKKPGADSLAVTSILDPDLHGQTVSLTEKDIDLELDSVLPNQTNTGDFDELELELNLDLDDDLLDDRDLGVNSTDISKIDDTGLDLDLDDSLEMELMKETAPESENPSLEIDDYLEPTMVIPQPDEDPSGEQTYDRPAKASAIESKEMNRESGSGVEAAEQFVDIADEPLEFDIDMDFDLDDGEIEPQADNVAAVGEFDLQETPDQPSSEVLAFDPDIDFELDESADESMAAEIEAAEAVDLDLDETMIEPVPDSEDELVDFELDESVEEALTMEADGDVVVDFDLDETVIEPAPDSEDELVDFELDESVEEALTMEADGDAVVDFDLDETMIEPAPDSEDKMVDFELEEPVAEALGAGTDEEDVVDFDLDETMIEPAPGSEDESVDFELDEPAAEALALEDDEDEVIDFDLDETAIEPVMDSEDEIIDFDLDEPAAEPPTALADEDAVVDFDLDTTVIQPASGDGDQDDFNLEGIGEAAPSAPADDEYIDFDLDEALEEPDDERDTPHMEESGGLNAFDAEGEALSEPQGFDPDIDFDLDEAFDEPAVEDDFGRETPAGEPMTSDAFDVDIDFDLDQELDDPAPEMPVSGAEFSEPIDDNVGFTLDGTGGDAPDPAEFDTDIDFDLDEALDEPLTDLPDQGGVAFDLDETEDELLSDDAELDEIVDHDEAPAIEETDLSPEMSDTRPSLADTWVDPSTHEGTGEAVSGIRDTEDLLLDDSLLDETIPGLDDQLEEPDISLDEILGDTSSGPVAADDQSDISLEDDALDVDLSSLDDSSEFGLNGTVDLPLDDDASIPEHFHVDLDEAVEDPEEEAALLGDEIDFDLESPFGPQEDADQASDAELEFEREVESLEASLMEEMRFDESKEADLEAGDLEVSPSEEAGDYGETAGASLDAGPSITESGPMEPDWMDGLNPNLPEDEEALPEQEIELAAQADEIENEAPVDIEDMFLDGGSVPADHDISPAEAGRPADFELKDLFPEESAGKETDFEPQEIDYSGMDMMEEPEVLREGVSIYLASEADTDTDEDEEPLVEPLDDFDIEEVVESAPEPPLEATAAVEAQPGAVDGEGDLALEEAWVEEMTGQEMDPFDNVEEYAASADDGHDDDYYSEEIEQYKLEAGVGEESVPTTALEEAPRPTEIPVPEVDMTRLELLIEKAVRKSVEKVLEKVLPGIIEEAVSKEIEKLLDEIE